MLGLQLQIDERDFHIDEYTSLKHLTLHLEMFNCLDLLAALKSQASTANPKRRMPKLTHLTAVYRYPQVNRNGVAHPAGNWDTLIAYIESTPLRSTLQYVEIYYPPSNPMELVEKCRKAFMSCRLDLKSLRIDPKPEDLKARFTLFDSKLDVGYEIANEDEAEDDGDWDDEEDAGEHGNEGSQEARPEKNQG